MVKIMYKKPMLLKKTHEIWWNERLETLDEKHAFHDLALEENDGLVAGFTPEFHRHQNFHEELTLLDQHERRIVHDLSENQDDWNRIHHAMPIRRQKNNLMTFHDLSMKDFRKWRRLQRLHHLMSRTTSRYRELNRIIGHLMEFFNDHQLARIQEYLTKIPKTFRGGDKERTCFVLACLDLELERHGYTILRQELINQINDSMNLSLTKMEIRKAKWQVLKHDARLCKARLKERMKHGEKRQRLIAINLLGQLIDGNDWIHSFLKSLRIPTSKFKHIVLQAFDSFTQGQPSKQLRNDLESTLAACIDLSLQQLHQNHAQSRRYRSFKWIPSALLPTINSLRNLKAKIRKELDGKIMSNENDIKTRMNANALNPHPPSPPIQMKRATPLPS